MIESVISETLEAVGTALWSLRYTLERYNTTDSIDQAFEDRIANSIKVMTTARATLVSTEIESSQWRPERLLKHISQDLADLTDRHCSLQMAAEMFSASSDTLSTAGKQKWFSTVYALEAAMAFAARDLLIIEKCIFALVRYYGHSGSLEDAVEGYDPELDTALAHYDHWWPQEIFHAAPLMRHLHRGERQSL